MSPCSRRDRTSVIADCQQLQLSGSDTDKASLSEPRSVHSPFNVQSKKKKKNLTRHNVQTAEWWGKQSCYRCGPRAHRWGSVWERADVHVAPCTSWCHADELFLVFSQWFLQLFRERRAQTRGGLIKSNRDTRGGGGRPRSRSNFFSFGCLASCKFKIRSLTNTWLRQWFISLSIPCFLFLFSLPEMHLSFQAAGVLLLAGIQPN